MANVGVSAIRLIDSDGDALDDGDGRLKVLLEAADLNIGNVDIHLNGGVALLGNAGAVAAGVLRVTLASDDPAVALLGTIDADTGTIVNDAFAIKTAVQIIDNAIHVDDSSFSLGSESGVAIMGFSGTQTIGANSVGALRCDTSGRLMVEIDSTTVDTDTCFRLNGEDWDNVDIGVGVFAVRNDTLVALSNVGDGDYTPFQVDAQGALYTTHGVTGMVHGINSDVDATAEQLDGSTSGLDTACKRVDLMGHPDNTGDIYVGSTNAIAGDGSVGGIRLQPGDFYSIDVNNLNDIWIEASIANQKLNYIYYT